MYLDIIIIIIINVLSMVTTELFTEAETEIMVLFTFILSSFLYKASSVSFLNKITWLSSGLRNN